MAAVFHYPNLFIPRYSRHCTNVTSPGSNPDEINEYYFYHTTGKVIQVAVLRGIVQWAWLKRTSLPWLISPVSMKGTQQTRPQFHISSWCQQARCWVPGAHKVDGGGWASALGSNPHPLELRHPLGFSSPPCKVGNSSRYCSEQGLVSKMRGTGCPMASLAWSWRDWKPNPICPLQTDPKNE